jgi:hypothetical protein
VVFKNPVLKKSTVKYDFSNNIKVNTFLKKKVLYIPNLVLENENDVFNSSQTVIYGNNLAKNYFMPIKVITLNRTIRLLSLNLSTDFGNNTW